MKSNSICAETHLISGFKNEYSIRQGRMVATFYWKRVMREIGTISDRNLANRFINFIRAKDIQGEIRIGDSDECEIWILREKRYNPKSKSLEAVYKKNPITPFI